MVEPLEAIYGGMSFLAAKLAEDAGLEPCFMVPLLGPSMESATVATPATTPTIVGDVACMFGDGIGGGF
jgi:hypothetical protein